MTGERHLAYAEHPARVLSIVRHARELLVTNPWDIMKALEEALRALMLEIALPVPVPFGTRQQVCPDWPSLRVACALLARSPGPGHKPSTTPARDASWAPNDTSSFGMGGPGEAYRRAVEEREVRTSSYERGLWLDNAIAQAVHEIAQGRVYG